MVKAKRRHRWLQLKRSFFLGLFVELPKDRYGSQAAVPMTLCLMSAVEGIADLQGVASVGFQTEALPAGSVLGGQTPGLRREKGHRHFDGQRKHQHAGAERE